MLLGGMAVLPACAQQPPAGIGSDWRTDWSRHTAPLAEIEVNLPRDAIPALDRPRFIPVAEAQAWLQPQEPVLALAVDTTARAYPLQILIWHEIVNDVLAGRPVAVTFCPLCYSALVFDRRVDGQLRSFGVSGMLRHSDLVMYDRETHTLWQQLGGEAIAGVDAGKRLTPLPAQIISFAQFQAAWPRGDVLSRETGFDRSYGRNPYTGYDDITQRPFLFKGSADERLPPMEKVVAVHLNGQDKAYPYRLTRQMRVVHDTLGGVPLVVFHAPGAVSALDAARISASREDGSTGVFDPRLDGRTLHFTYHDGVFTDRETGSVWDVTGRATSGPLAGRRLSPRAHGDYFAFAWLVFKPGTTLYTR